MNETEEIVEKALLVGCQTYQTDEHFERSMEELKSLAHTAKAQVVTSIKQKKQRADHATYIGKGKLEEIDALLEKEDINLIIFNNELTPSQLRNLTNYFDKKIIDRTQLILDIFAMRAQTKERKLQVEAAQLKYLLPRLVGQGVNMSRQGGGIGLRGPGETKLESDRRHIRKRMSDVKVQLEDVVKHRERYREDRKEREWTQVAIVGYTNAGKSTLFNRLTQADTLEENLLFATLDTTTRKFNTSKGLDLLLTDTVGFIQDLPTTLVAAFKSTLEEVLEAHYIIQVIDCSDPDYEQHETTVQKLLKEIGVKDTPIFKVYNKRDQQLDTFTPDYENPYVVISAMDDQDLQHFNEQFVQFLQKRFWKYRLQLTPEQGGVMAVLKKYTFVNQLQFLEEEGVYELTGYMPPRLKPRYENYYKK